MTAPAPYVPANADLRDFPAMLLDVVRLRDSRLALTASGDEFMAAVLLWAAAWHQVPAGSLPEDERELAGLAKVEPRKWARVRAMVLRQWVLCSDGRLHHPVIAEKALECWIEKLNARISSGMGHAKRWGQPFDREPLDAELANALDLLHRLNPKSRALAKARRPARAKGQGDTPETDADGVPVAMPVAWQQKGTEGNTLPERADAQPEDPNKEAWRRGPAVIAMAGRTSNAGARQLFGKLLRDHGLEARDLLPAVVKAEGLGTADPQGYLTAAARALAKRSNGGTAPVDVAGWDDDVWAVALANYGEDGAWSEAMGPRPGEPGCMAPANLVLRIAQ